uniref:PAM2 domain-containing protein n=1 Tax=Heterorhabditis bacteriophora TaxID=37862 RepID=A0A1I7XVJ9_HETBA
MDSPTDTSPNVNPIDFEDPNTFANIQGQLINFSPTGHTSTEGSVDSSGFEKLDHDVLAEYGQQLANQMFAKQSVLSQLPDHPEETVGFTV